MGKPSSICIVYIDQLQFKVCDKIFSYKAFISIPSCCQICHGTDQVMFSTAVDRAQVRHADKLISLKKRFNPSPFSEKCGQTLLKSTDLALSPIPPAVLRERDLQPTAAKSRGSFSERYIPWV